MDLETIALATTVSALRSRDLGEVTIPIVGQTGPGQTVEFEKWIGFLRGLGIQQVGIGTHSRSEEHELPEYVLHAFAGGGTPYLLRVIADSGSFTFVIAQEQGSQYKIQAQQFTEWVNAQPSASHLWKFLESQVFEHLEMNSISVDGLRPLHQNLAFVDALSWDYMIPQWFRELQIEAFVLGDELVVPHGLEAYFYKRDSLPDFMRMPSIESSSPQGKSKKEAARERYENDGLLLAPEPKPWVRLNFKFLGDLPVLALDGDLQKNRKELTESLMRAAEFSLRAGSAFLPSFQIALAALGSDWIHGPYDDKHLGELKDLLLKKKLEPKSVEFFPKRLGFAAYFYRIGVRPELIQGFLAVEYTDVFGGMGSWNDQMFEADFQEEYDRVSRDLFQSLQDFRKALFNSL